MTEALKVFSVVIAWCDGDAEQGDWGTYVRAANDAEAVKLARLAMRADYIANEMPEGGDPVDFCDQYEGLHGFGGSVVACDVGPIWLASQLETALRSLLAEVDEMTARAGWAGNGGRDEARKVLAEIDAIDGPDVIFARAADAAGWEQGGDGNIWWHSSHGSWKNAVSWGRTYATARDVVESEDYPKYQGREDER